MKLSTACGVVTSRRGSRCTQHARQSNRSRHNALYSTRAWQRLSARVLRAWRGEHGHWCPGYQRPAHLAADLTVDHVVPLAAGGAPLDIGNWAVLCRSCNSTKGAGEGDRGSPHAGSALPEDRATVKEPYFNRHLIPVADGDSVGLEYDPKSHHVLFDSSDPRTSEKAQFRAQQALDQQQFEAALLGAPAPAARSSDEDQEPLVLNWATGSGPEVASAMLSRESQVLDAGTSGTASVISTVSPNKTVRDMNSAADPSHLDDPVWLFDVQVGLSGRAPFRALFADRVPLSGVGDVSKGVRLAVAVNQANPTQEIAADWNRSPLP